MPRRRLMTTLFLLLSLLLPGPAVSAAGLEGALKHIISQIDENPNLRVAGEPIFMADELGRFYAEREFQPLWSADEIEGRRQIRTLIDILGESRAGGLCTADYHLRFFRELRAHFSLDEDVYDRPRLRWSGWYDVLLTDALFHYARHMLSGRIPADAIQEGWNFRKPEVDLVKVLNYAFDNNELEKVLHDFAPGDPGYLGLQRALEHYRDIESLGGWLPIPSGALPRLGVFDIRLPRLRTRLLLSGDLKTLPAKDADRLAEADIEALKRFQSRHGLAADGLLGERTLKALNMPVAERVRQIELNLERWRWLPKSLGQSYLLVNIAAFSLELVEDGRQVLSMPVVVGNRFRKTPVFSAGLSYIEFAPYWYVPPTILEEDKLPRIRKDVTYLARNHYEIVAWDRTTIINPEDIDWATVNAASFPGMLRQKPGPWNALGRIKFMLPNSYAVYLHDTNNQRLFGERSRQFSSGCIRLKEPVMLAAHLLADSGWREEDIEQAMQQGEPHAVTLPRSLPVHVLYWTAWVDSEGITHFREDVYGRDRDLEKGLARVVSACAIHRKP